MSFGSGPAAHQITFTLRVAVRACLGRPGAALIRVPSCFALRCELAWERRARLATGAMLVSCLLDEMERRELRYGVAALPGAFGVATATVFERLV